jgi:hypothetical protein
MEETARNRQLLPCPKQEPRIKGNTTTDLQTATQTPPEKEHQTLSKLERNPVYPRLPPIHGPSSDAASPNSPVPIKTRTPILPFQNFPALSESVSLRNAHEVTVRAEIALE